MHKGSMQEGAHTGSHTYLSAMQVLLPDGNFAPGESEAAWKDYANKTWVQLEWVRCWLLAGMQLIASMGGCLPEDAAYNLQSCIIWKPVAGGWCLFQDHPPRALHVCTVHISALATSLPVSCSYCLGLGPRARLTHAWLTHLDICHMVATPQVGNAFKHYKTRVDPTEYSNFNKAMSDRASPGAA